MARKTTVEPPPPDPELRVGRSEAVEKLNDRIALGAELLRREIGREDEGEAYTADCSKWSAYNTELLKRLFTTPALAEEYSWSSSAGLVVRRYEPSPGEVLEEARERLTDRIRSLESILERLDLIPEVAGTAARAVSPPTASAVSTNRVFIVHGHDDEAREACARLLSKIGVEPVILHEQATSGRTIVEKLEHYADVGFAVVLLTPDDVGGVEEGKLQPRARQNVILELGYFVGRIGRSNVCALHKGPLELPTDYLGVVYVEMDTHGAWKYTLTKELRAAGFAVDMNRI